MNTISQIKKTTIRNTTISFLFTMLLISIIGSQNTNAGIIDFESLPEMTASAPTALDASEITTTSFRARWNPVAGAVSYKLYVLHYVGSLPGGQELWNTLSQYNGIPVIGTSVPVTGLSNNTRYRYYVQAVTGGVSSANSNTISVTTLAVDAPFATAATNITHNSFTANWNSVTGATSYKLYVEMNFLGLLWTSIDGYEDGKVVSGTSHNVSPLLQLTEHRYWVIAVNANGESGNSNTINLQTRLTPTTTNAAYNISSTSFTANWNAVTGINTYLLTVSRDSDQHVIINNLEVNGTLHTVTGLSTGHAYRYAVKTKTDNNVSDNSNWTSVTTAPATPVAKAATNINATSFQANWDAAAGATAYKLSVWKKIGLQWVPGYNEKIVSGTSEVITGLEPLTEYRYRLQALAGSTESGFSIVIDVTTSPLPPVALPATNITSTSFTANWETFTAAVHYELYVFWSDPNILSKWRVVEGYNGIEVHGLEKIVTGLASNTEYKYFIRARYENNDESDPSNEIFVTTDDVGTSVNSITEANISIYPNPAQNHISIEGVEKNSTIDIFSITGAKMMRLENQSGSIKIDVSGLNNGLYIIKISSDNGDISRKIFVNE